MFDVIYYIFSTEQDMKLYYNQKHLITDLIHEGFLPNEISQAISWFNPVIDSYSNENSFYQANAIRDFDYIEKKSLSHNIINRILVHERNNIINSFQRDLLIDRLSMLSPDGETDEVETILDKLVFHLNNYKFGLITEETNHIPTAWNANFTIH